MLILHALLHVPVFCMQLYTVLVWVISYFYFTWTHLFLQLCCFSGGFTYILKSQSLMHMWACTINSEYTSCAGCHANHKSVKVKDPDCPIQVFHSLQRKCSLSIKCFQKAICHKKDNLYIKFTFSSVPAASIRILLISIQVFWDPMQFNLE